MCYSSFFILFSITNYKLIYYYFTSICRFTLLFIQSILRLSVMSPKKKPRSKSPTVVNRKQADIKIGKASENGNFAINTLFRIAADRLSSDKCPYLSNYLNFELEEDQKPSPQRYLDMHRTSIQANNPQYAILVRVRELYTEDYLLV